MSRVGLPEFVHLRLGHAQVVHFELSQVFDSWLSEYEPALVPVGPDDEGWTSWRLAGTGTQLPPRAGVLFGSWLHALRSSLDNVVFDLARGSELTWEKARQLDFPFTYDARRWKEAAKRLARLDPAVLKVVERWQPIHRDESGSAMMLAMLHDMCNVDKHQLVMPALYVASPSRFDIDVVHAVEPARAETRKNLDKAQFKTGDEVWAVRAFDADDNVLHPTDHRVSIEVDHVLFYFESKNRHEILMGVDQMHTIGGIVREVVDQMYAAADPRS